MKPLCLLLLSCPLLLSGCYTETSLPRDEIAPDDHTVCFYLADGSFVKSSADKHHRAEGGAGYELTGTLVKRTQAKDRFEGTLPDSTIARVAVERFSWSGTAFMVLGASWVISLVGWGISGAHLPLW